MHRTLQKMINTAQIYKKKKNTYKDTRTLKDMGYGRPSRHVPSRHNQGDKLNFRQESWKDQQRTQFKVIIRQCSLEKIGFSILLSLNESNRLSS